MELLDFEKLNAYLNARQLKALRTELSQMNEVDVAAFIEQAPDDQQLLIFRTLPKDMAADVFSEVGPEIQEMIIRSMTDQELSTIVEDLFVDDAVDMLEEMPANIVKRVLKSATPDTRRLINQFLSSSILRIFL